MSSICPTHGIGDPCYKCVGEAKKKVKTKPVKVVNVASTINKLHKDVIAKYIENAEKAGAEKVNFIFGNETKVSFSIILKKE